MADLTNDGASPTGRPPKLTEERLQAILAILRRGCFRSVAARAAGISPRTLQRWMELGKRSPHGLYGRLARAVPLAEAKSEASAVAAIFAAGKKDAKFYCWFLERKYPHRWGQFRGEMGELKRRLRDLENRLNVEPLPE